MTRTLIVEIDADDLLCGAEGARCRLCEPTNGPRDRCLLFGRPLETIPGEAFPRRCSDCYWHDEETLPASKKKAREEHYTKKDQEDLNLYPMCGDYPGTKAKEKLPVEEVIRRDLEMPMAVYFYGINPHTDDETLGWIAKRIAVRTTGSHFDTIYAYLKNIRSSLRHGRRSLIPDAYLKTGHGGKG